MSRPSDGCGEMVSEGVEGCAQCNIYFCFICQHHLRNLQKKASIRIDCPMCGKPPQRE